MNKQELLKFICEMFNIPQCPEMIQRQIHKYVTERGYDYLDIARALSFWVDVQNRDLELKYGIGIVPFVIEQARAYYRELKAQQEAQIKAAQKAKTNPNKENVVYVQCKRTHKIHIPHINIDEL